MFENARTRTAARSPGRIALCVVMLLCIAVGAAHPAQKRTRAKAARKAARSEAPAELKLNLSLPPVESFTTDNGVRVFCIRSDLPELSLVVSAGYGKLYESARTAGSAELLARTLLMGGSRKYPGESLHRALEAAGGRFNVEASWEETLISIRVLERHADLALDIIGDLLSNPNIEDRAFADAKALVLEGIRRKKDSPEVLAFEKLRELVFAGSGYGAVPREETVAPATAAEMQRLWTTHFTSGNIMVAASSSMDPGELKGRLLKYLAGVPTGGRVDYEADRARIRESVRSAARRVYFIRRPIPQATVVVGTVTPRLSDPKNYSLGVMNYILGEGSFNSRLMQEIRVKRGLSYSVASIIKPRRETGVFIAYAQTKNEQADATLALLVENVRKMAKSPVSRDELVWAKRAIVSSYIFEFEMPLSLLGKYIFVERGGLPASYLTEYPARINEVRAETILKDGRELFQDGLVKVVVGGEKARGGLSRFGELVEISI